MKQKPKAMPEQPWHHEHDIALCRECAIVWSEGNDAQPARVVYRTPWLFTWAILGIGVFTYFMGLCFVIYTPVIHDGGYPVYRNVYAAPGPWKEKCRKAWAILKTDPRDGRKAFKVLDQDTQKPLRAIPCGSEGGPDNCLSNPNDHVYKWTFPDTSGDADMGRKAKP